MAIFPPPPQGEALRGILGSIISMGGAGSTCLGCVLPVGGHSPAPQPLPLPCEDSELTPAVGCVCSLWCSSDSVKQVTTTPDQLPKESGHPHSLPTGEGSVHASQRAITALCLHTCPGSPGGAVSLWLAETPLPRGSEELLGEQGQELCPVPSGVLRAPGPSRVDSGPLFFLLPEG